jgi:hypothetical protein
MNKLRSVVLASLLCTPGVFASDITITVVPTLAPNAYGSPNWTTWVANSLTALESGSPAAGDPGTPGYYQALTVPVDASETIVTGFNSWLGQAEPAAPFAGEYGNRLTFGLAILGNGEQFSISQLGFDASSNDAGDVLGFGGLDPDGIAADGYGPGGYDYSSAYVGVIFGTGGNPNTYITGGSDSQLVDAIYSRGSGNSVPVDCSGCDQADEQAAIAAGVATMAGVTEFTGTYYLSNNSDGSDPFATGSGTFDITGTTPEPGTWLLLLAGLPAVALLRRRRIAQRVPCKA